MVQTTNQVQTTTTVSSALPATAEVIRNEPVVKTITEAPIVANIIEKKNVEVHERKVIKEVHEQPIIEIERRVETKFVEQQPIENRVVAPTKFEEVGERTIPNLPLQHQSNVVPTVESSVHERELPPIIEKVVEQPVYKQVIIEQHEIPVQTVYTTVPVIHPSTQVDNSAFQFKQMTTELTGIQQTQQLQAQTVQTGLQQPLLAQQPLTQTIQPGLQQGFRPDQLRLVRSGYSKSVWGLSHGGELYRMDRSAKMGMMWEKFLLWEGFGGMRFTDFSAIKRGNLWLLGQDGQLYQLDPKTRHEGMLRPMFQGMTGFPRFQSISALDDSHCYLLAEDGSVHLFDNGRLLRINGQLKSLSAGKKRFLSRNFELWGIGLDGNAKRWNGEDAWLDMGLPVRDVAVGTDNSVYAIDSAGQLVKWAHNANRFEAVRSKFANENGVTPMQFTGVSVFKEHRGVHCIDSQGNVYTMDV